MDMYFTSSLVQPAQATELIFDFIVSKVSPSVVITCSLSVIEADCNVHGDRGVEGKQKTWVCSGIYHFHFLRALAFAFAFGGYFYFCLGRKGLG